MNILEEIIARKRIEVAGAKKNTPVSELENSPFFKRETISLKAALERENVPSIIAEFKRRSPSRGEINSRVKPAQIAQDYQNAGATAMSVLTDTISFGGATHDLVMARQNAKIPLLRKEFMIDPYQIIEAKAIGADAILLIAACLTPNHLKEMAQTAQQYGLEVLLEVHNQAELESHLNKYVSVVGVNNRNLKTFDVSIDTSLKLANLIPDEFVKISESGLRSSEEIVKLHKAGYQGFLIGESFMKSADPGKSCKELLLSIDQLLNPEAML